MPPAPDGPIGKLVAGARAAHIEPAARDRDSP